MINLALKSILYGWRRYLPVVIAIGVSGLMMVTQAALAMGVFSLSAAPVRQSQADLWVGPVDAETLDESRGLTPLAVGRLWLDPAIIQIEPYSNPAFVTIGDNEETGEFGVVIALPLNDKAMTMARIIPPKLRAKLAEPGTLVLDRSDARSLGVGIGDRIRIDRNDARVVGLLDGVKGLFGVQLIASELTARTLSQEIAGNGNPAFYLVRLRPGTDPQDVAGRLTDVFPSPEYRIWQPRDLANSTIRSWVLESGAGTSFLAASSIALVITLMVVNQTLGAAIVGAIREYAALRAYGVGFRSVQWVVMKQGLYVCFAALLLTATASAGVLWFLYLRGVAAELPWPLALAVLGGLVVTVIVSNLFALRRLRHADPAALLR